MKKRAKTVLASALAIVSIAAVIARLMGHRPNTPDPIYHGQPLTVWVDRSLGAAPSDFRETLNLLMYHGSSADNEAQTLWNLHGDQIISCWINALKTKDNVLWKPYTVLRQNLPRVLTRSLPEWKEPQKVREAALWWLGEMHPEAAVPGLCEVAVRDSNRMNRRRAVSALRNIGIYSPQVYQVMVTALISDPNPANRVDAAYWFKDTTAAPEIAIPVFLGYLQDTNAELRRASCFALGAYGAQAKTGLEPLRKLAGATDGYPDMYVSWGANWAIKAIQADIASNGK